MPTTWIGLLLLLMCGAYCPAAEITTNGAGGGRWSEGTTWRGGRVPTGDDDVVVRKFDVVVFDRDDRDGRSCAKLQVDPKGVLQFQTNRGRVAMVVGDAVEIYGAVKLDGTKADGDQLEWQFAGGTAEQRRLVVAKGGSLLLYGKRGLAEGLQNVRLFASAAETGKEILPLELEVNGPAAVDLQRAKLGDVRAAIKQIDNTGGRPTERVQVVECHWQGRCRLLVTGCDSAVIAKNVIDYGGPATQDIAIQTNTSPLVEIQQNIIRGKFQAGIGIHQQVDPAVIGNDIAGPQYGILAGQGVPNAMLQRNTLRDVQFGLNLEGTTGVLEQTTLTNVEQALLLSNVALQATDFAATLVEGSKLPAVSLTGGTLALLNGNLKPEQIKISPYADGSNRPTHVVSQQYVVVAAANAAAGSLIEVRTADPPPKPGAADLNVRHSPAVVREGRTAAPREPNPLVVKAWTLEASGSVTPAPEYEIKLLGPAPREGEPRPVVKAVKYRPAADGYRASRDDVTPTVEIQP